MQDDFLGFQARDSVTGFQGIIVAVKHHIDGETVVYLQPKADGDRLPGQAGFSLNRVVVDTAVRVKVDGAEIIKMLR